MAFGAGPSPILNTCWESQITPVDTTGVSVLSAVSHPLSLPPALSSSLSIVASDQWSEPQARAVALKKALFQEPCVQPMAELPLERRDSPVTYCRIDHRLLFTSGSREALRERCNGEPRQ